MKTKVVLYWEIQGGEQIINKVSIALCLYFCAILQIELIYIVISGKLYMTSYIGYIFATQIKNAPDLLQKKFQFIRIKFLLIRIEYPFVRF